MDMVKEVSKKTPKAYLDDAIDARIEANKAKAELAKVAAIEAAEGKVADAIAAREARVAKKRGRDEE